MAKQTPTKTKAKPVTKFEQAIIELPLKITNLTDRIDRFEKDLDEKIDGKINKHILDCINHRGGKKKQSIPPDKKTLMTPERLATAKYIGTIIGTTVGTALVMYLAGG